MVKLRENRIIKVSAVKDIVKTSIATRSSIMDSPLFERRTLLIKKDNLFII